MALTRRALFGESDAIRDDAMSALIPTLPGAVPVEDRNVVPAGAHNDATFGLLG